MLRRWAFLWESSSRHCRYDLIWKKSTRCGRQRYSGSIGGRKNEAQ